MTAKSDAFNASTGKMVLTKFQAIKEYFGNYTLQEHKAFIKDKVGGKEALNEMAKLCAIELDVELAEKTQDK